MAVWRLAGLSLWNRRATALLTVVSIALSVCLLLGVERVRTDARAAFASTISGTDLIVGARSGPVQLLLYSVFRIGDASNNMSWSSFETIAQHPKVAWAVPISLGDSHRGFRVLGTTGAYFEHYRYGRKQALAFASGRGFEDVFDAVIGAQVARDLGYHLGDELILAHGGADVAFARHKGFPFKVVGVLAPTGTPVDATVHVRLKGLGAIHLGWENGVPVVLHHHHHDAHAEEEHDEHEGEYAKEVHGDHGEHGEHGSQMSEDEVRAHLDAVKIDEVTAALVGLRNKSATFLVQRWINDFEDEPLTAILPGVALSQLWGLIGVAENALLVVSAFVVVVGLFGMLSALLTSLRERRREMAILRSVGARPGHVFSLIMGEAGGLTALGIVLGVGLLFAFMALADGFLQARFGMRLSFAWLQAREWFWLLGVWCAGLLVGVVPAWASYRQALADGLSVRV